MAGNKSKNIPDKINMMNVYQKGRKLIGVSDEITVPDLEAMSETISGAGILGEMDVPTVGQFADMEMEIPFRTLDTDMFSLVTPNQVIDLTLRASKQVLSAQGLDFEGIRIVVRGMFKGFTGGSIKQGSPTNSTVKVGVHYILIELNGTSVIELDKINTVYKVNGVDMLAKSRSLC